MKYREFWIVRSVDKDLSAAGFVYVRESGHQQEIHVIDYTAYTDALKMLEEMAGAANNIHLKFDKDLAFIGGLAALNEALDKYRKWKEGMK